MNVLAKIKAFLQKLKEDYPTETAICIFAVVSAIVLAIAADSGGKRREAELIAQRHHIEEFKKCVDSSGKTLPSGTDAVSYCAVTLDTPIPYTRK